MSNPSLRRSWHQAGRALLVWAAAYLAPVLLEAQTVLFQDSFNTSSEDPQAVDGRTPDITTNGVTWEAVAGTDSVRLQDGNLEFLQEEATAVFLSWNPEDDFIYDLSVTFVRPSTFLNQGDLAQSIGFFDSSLSPANLSLGGASDLIVAQANPVSSDASSRGIRRRIVIGADGFQVETVGSEPAAVEGFTTLTLRLNTSDTDVQTSGTQWSLAMMVDGSAVGETLFFSDEASSQMSAGLSQVGMFGDPSLHHLPTATEFSLTRIPAASAVPEPSSFAAVAAFAGLAAAGLRRSPHRRKQVLRKETM